MDTKAFLENFGHIADAQNGVGKLRELILELAFQGKIEAQNQNNEPVQELINKLQEEKSKLIQSKKIKNAKPFPEISREEKLFQIPDVWGWIRLADTGTIFNGNSISASVKSAKYEGLKEGYPYIATKDVGYGKNVLGYENGVKIPEGEPKFKIAHQNAVLICSEGGSAGRKIGITDRDICFGNKLYANELFSGIEPRFVFYFYQNSSFLRQFREKMTGIIGGISLNNFISLVMPLPPEEEQKRIVDKVDQLMDLCVQLETQQKQKAQTRVALNNAVLDKLLTAQNPDEFNQCWQRIAKNFHYIYDNPKNLAKLRALILQLSMQGKLVEQNKNDENASFLLERFKTKRADLLSKGKIQKAKFIQTVDQDDIPFKLPATWTWARLSFIAEVIDPNPSHRMPKYVESGIPFISTENFTDDDKLNFSIGKRVTEETLREQTKRFELRPGSFALSRIGTIGKTISLPLERNYCMSHALCVISPFDDELNTDYLRLAVTADSVLEQAHAGTKSIGVPDLGMGVIRSFLIPLPPSEEQKRIVVKVDQLMTLCDKLETKLKQTRITSEKLVEAIVKSVAAA